MEDYVGKIGESTKASGTEIGESLKNVKYTFKESIEDEIAFLLYASRYTNKSSRKKRQQARLLYLRAMLESIELGETLLAYTMSLSRNAREE